jgi:hypothetical protein
MARREPGRDASNRRFGLAAGQDLGPGDHPIGAIVPVPEATAAGGV